MAGRPQSVEQQAIVELLEAVKDPPPAGFTAREVAHALQLSVDAANVHMTRLRDRGVITSVGERVVQGSTRPVKVYRKVSADLYPTGTIFESLNRAIARRLAIREAG